MDGTAAVNRFGLGARPEELRDATGDPHGWLLAQVQPFASLPAVFAGLPSTPEMLRARASLQQRRRRQRQSAPVDAAAGAGAAAEAADPLRQQQRTLSREALRHVQARNAHAVASTQPLAERLVRFWSNHFAVSVDKNAIRLLAAPMELEAIRPRVFGRFADLLLAVQRHPAMLGYLDNDASVGPDSAAALRAQRAGRQRGLNENLAREILELHTLGVDGGYSQADVTELARALTGWGVAAPMRVAADDSAHGFVFRAAAHQPGVRQMLGRRYPQAGIAQAEAMLRDLARHPATALHLAFKLARHFVADAPPPDLVAAIAKSWQDSDGDLAVVYRTLIEHPLAWQAQARKFKTPEDWLLSAQRATGLLLPAQALLALSRGLGQPLFMPRSPAGFPDTAADWLGADALRKRVQAATGLAARAVTDAPPLALARQALGEDLDADLAAALRGAGSFREGVALLLASPDFQWRA